MSGPEEKKAVNSPQDKKTAVLEAVISLVMEGKSLEALTVSETAPGRALERELYTSISPLRRL